MDSFSKKLIAELAEMEQAGRRLRNLSLARMMPYKSGSWQPPVDVYESEEELFLYVDLSGVDNESLALTVDERHIRIKGVRRLPPHPSIACVHQLEIEMGSFDRTVSLPTGVEVNRVSSVYSDGILVVTLPKRKQTCKVQIRIIPGE